MANLQYVGARYVPKFYENSLDPSSCEWESGVGYEPLTVVSYNDNTYTSKRPVPSSVGNPASNSTYWSRTADYNAALSALQNSVAKLEFLARPKKYIFIGDSWNTHLTPSGGVPITPWSSAFISLMGLTASDYYNSGVSGSGYTAGTTFLGQLNSIANNLTDDEKAEITDIIVIGGINDYNTPIATVNTAVNTFVNTALSLFPNAMVNIIIEQWSTSSSQQQFLRELIQYLTVANSTKKRARFINLQGACKLYRYYQPDGGHIGSANYVNYLMKYLINILQGGTKEIHWRFPTTPTFEAAVAPMTFDIVEEQTNDRQYIQCVNTLDQYGSWAFTNNVAITTNIQYKIGHHDPELMRLQKTSVIDSGFYWAHSDTPKYISGYYEIVMRTNGDLYLILNYSNTSSGNENLNLTHLYLKSDGAKYYETVDC